MGDLRMHKYTANVTATNQAQRNTTYEEVWCTNPPQQQATSYITSAWDYDTDAPALNILEEKKRKIAENAQKRKNKNKEEEPPISANDQQDHDEMVRSFKAYKNSRPPKKI